MRTSRALAGAVALLVVTAACSSEREDAQDRLPAVTAPPSEVPMPDDPLPPRIASLAVRCPDADVEPQFPPGGQMPTGATQVRLCNHTGDRLMGEVGHPELDYRVPADALTSNVDRVVRAVNAAPVPPPEDPEEGRTFCAGVGAPTQVLWFSYPETDLAVTYNAGACLGLTVGLPPDREGHEVAETFGDELWAQRAGRRPPDSHPRASCWPTVVEETPLALSDRLDLVDAVVCDYPRGGRVRQARLPAEALEAVNADFSPAEGDAPARCPPRMLRGVTAWGDVFTWWGGCWDFPLQTMHVAGRHWQASPTVRALLRGLRFGRARKQDTTNPGL